METIVRLLRGMAIALLGLACAAIGIYLYLLSEGVLSERRAVYGFRLVARVTIGGNVYTGETDTECVAEKRFPLIDIEYKQHGDTLALRLNDGKVLFVDYGRLNQRRRCDPRDELWQSSKTAPWPEFKAALSHALQQKRQLPIDVEAVGVYVADDPAHPKHVTRVDPPHPEASLGPGGRLDALHIQPVRDPRPRDVAHIIPWSHSTEHDVKDPLQCMSFLWSHAIIERASVPKIEAITSALESSEGRLVDLAPYLSRKDEVALANLIYFGRPGARFNRTTVSEDYSTVSLAYPRIEPDVVQYFPGPTIPWDTPWQNSGNEPFAWPWSPSFCMSDGYCFKAPSPGRKRTKRFFLEPSTGVIHQLAIHWDQFSWLTFGTRYRPHREGFCMWDFL